MGCGCNKNNIENENENYLDINKENEINIKEKISSQMNNESNNNNNNIKDKIEKNTTLFETFKNQEILLTLRSETEENNFVHNNQYNKRVFELINQIRVNPPEYSKTIIDNIQYITYEAHQEINNNTGMKDLTTIIVFKKKVKVQLFIGEKAFKEAANIIRNTQPMEKLIFNKDIVVPFPNDGNDIKSSNYFKLKSSDISLRTNPNINAYFRDFIKNPEIAVLLMIVGDNESYKGKKREAILNRDFKYIGIDNKFFGKNFVAHFSFSK